MPETIADQVRAMREATAGTPPDPARAAYAHDRERLAADGVPHGAIGVGDLIPDTDLLDSKGQPLTLSAALENRPGVLVFYRGAWCPYCNIALRTYQAQLLPMLRRRAVGLVAVSPQRPDASLSLAEKEALEFPVLSDPGLILARHLGIAYTPPPDVIAANLGRGLDVSATSADGTDAVPMPATVVLDADRLVRWVDVHPDYSTRSEVADILTAVDSMPT